MEKLAAVLATVAIGAMIALQPPVNSQLAKASTVLVAAFVSTAIAALVLGVVVLVAGQIGSVGRVTEVSPFYLTGGLMGAILVGVSLVTVRTLGAGGVVAAMVLGQLVVSALLDRAGAFGLEPVELTPVRLAGFALLMLGTVLVVLR